MDKFAKFQKAYENSLEAIHSYLNDDYEDMRLIAKWLLETQHNPYGFLPDSYAGSLDTAEGFSSLLGTIHHALVDDGDISFPVVNGEPRIRFVHRHERGVETYVLTDQELEWATEENSRFMRSEYEIEWLKNVGEFIAAKDQYEVEQLKRYFLHEADPHNIDRVLEYYKDKPGFDMNWVNEVT